MSQGPSDSQIVAAYQADLATAFVISSITTLAAYEYVITIEREVVMVWWRKWTLATWIFIVNRYLMITVVIMEIAPASAKSCSGGLVALDVLPVAQYCVFAVFSTLRVFSIWNRNIPMSLLVLLLNLVPVITSIYKFTQESDMFAVDPIFGTFCGSILNIPIATNLDIALGTRLAVITADAIVLAVTWKKTYKNRKDGLRLGMEIPLTSLLLRDGTMYFVAHLAMNVAQVLINSVPSLQNISPVGEIIDVLIPILISRFLLNLRQIGEPQNNTVDVSQSRFSAPMFRAPTLASIIGNMGQELEHGSIGEVKVGSAVGERVIEPKEDTSMLDEGVQCDPQVDCLVVKDTITMNEIREVPRTTLI